MIEREYAQVGDKLTVTLTIPRYQTGTYTYDPDKEYTVDNVCVYINKNMCEYSLSHLNYLDYKGSLQPSMPIFFFEDEEEAVRFAKDFDVNLFYA